MVTWKTDLVVSSGNSEVPAENVSLTRDHSGLNTQFFARDRVDLKRGLNL